RTLGGARAEGDGRGGGAEGLPEFGERAIRDFERSSSPMRIFDRETLEYLAVNDAAVKFYGYSRDEFLSLTLRDTRHHEEHGAQLASLERSFNYLQHGAPRRQIKKSGEIVIVELVTQDVLFSGRPARLALTIDITGRLRMQELLWQRQQEFESLAENLPDLVARYNCNRRFVYANSAIEKALGRARADIVGKTQREVGLPEDLIAIYDASLTGVFATGAPHKVEFHLTLPSGERYFEAHHVPELDTTGAIGSVLCVARDITEHIRVEDELKGQQRILDAVIDNLPVGVFIRDARTHRFLRRNRFAQDRFGPRKDSSVGKTPHEIFLPEQADQFVQSDRRLLESGRMEEIPDQRVTDPETGATRIQHLRKVPLYDENGQPWLIVGVADDVTERKGDLDLKNRLAAIVSHSRDAVISKDLDGIIRTWNPAAERLFGYSAEEAIGRSATMLIPPERREEENLILERVRNGLPIEAFESVRVRKNGTRVDVSISISPIQDGEGRIVGASNIARDITERKQNELAVLRGASLARLLESLARAANQALTPEDAMVACLERICRHGRWVLGRVELFDGSNPHEVAGRSIWYAPDRERFEEFIRFSTGRVHKGEGPFGQLLREHAAVWLDDLKRQAGFVRWQSAHAHGLRSAFAFPVIVHGEVVASMELFSDETRPQDPHIMGAAHSLASQLARIVERDWALRANARMAAIVESSHDAIISRTLEGTILTWNIAAERLFGYTAAEIVGQSIEILYPEELKPAMFRRQQALLKGLEVSPYETVRLAKDGRRVHVSTSPAAIRDSNGNICGVSTIMQDISHRKVAEQALRRSEERFRRLAENMDQVFWIDTPACDNNLYVSPAFERVWGRSVESLRSAPGSWWDAVHPKDQPRLREAVSQISRGHHMDVEYRIVRPDGTIRWIRDRSYPMPSDGETPLICGIAEDITVQKLAEQQRRSQETHQRDALVREVHHRIKNSLQGVAGLLRQKTRKLPAIAPDVEEAISQLQAVAVVYGLQGTRADGLLSLAEMVEAICVSAEGLLGGRVDRSFERLSQRPACIGGSEAVSVAVALNELVFNALKHQAAAAGRKRARVALCETRDAVEIRITNRGRLPKRFDFLADRGVGTGLSLVRTLLASPGASIEFSGKRSEVEVLLKLRPPLLAERGGGRIKRANHGDTTEEEAAATYPGRG
ncbi:MAG TPA: PAS domain S-box protein, partial [Burkholderiales bacterium]|nr:PAS domain S-box protein [Burkholderiales bacterium]